MSASNSITILISLFFQYLQVTSLDIDILPSSEKKNTQPALIVDYYSIVEYIWAVWLLKISG